MNEGVRMEAKRVEALCDFTDTHGVARAKGQKFDCPADELNRLTNAGLVKIEPKRTASKKKASSTKASAGPAEDKSS